MILGTGVVFGGSSLHSGYDYLMPKTELWTHSLYSSKLYHNNPDFS